MRIILAVLLLVPALLSTLPAQAQYTVTTTAGDTGAGSLGAALTSSSGDGAATSDTVSFNSLFNSTQTITLSAPYPTVAKNSGVNLTLQAPGAVLTLDGGGNTIFNFAGAGNFSLSNLNLQNGGVSLSGNANLDLVGVTSSAAIGGQGSLVLTGPVSLTGSNTYTGGTLISTGTVNVSSALNLGTGFVELLSGTLQVSTDINFSQAMTMYGGTIDTNGHSVTWSGNIDSWYGILTKSGAGTLTLNSALDMYSTPPLPTVQIQGGTLIFGQDPGTFMSMQVSIGPSGVLNLNGKNEDFGVLDGSGGVSLEAARITVGSNFFGYPTSPDSFYSGVISGTGGLIKVGDNTLTLSGANDYSGGTSLATGTLSLGNENGLGTGELVMAAGTTLRSGVNASTYSNAISLAGNATYDINSNYSNLSGVISGTGSLTVVNSGSGGEVFFQTTNSYSGGTNILGGSVYVNGNAIGSGSLTNSGHVGLWNSYNAGSITITNNASGIIGFAGTSSLDSASAGSAAMRNDGTVYFESFSTAANAAITTTNYLGFQDSSTAGNANIGNSGFMGFSDNASAGAATINNNGTLEFTNNGDGGTARLIQSGLGLLDISGETGASVTIGSLEGSGSVSLGGVNLTTGANNLSTLFSGVMADGGVGGGTGGSLTKTGTGTFTLSGPNVYTGGTDIEGGVLMAGNADALGTGNVTVNGGTLQINGPATLNIGGNYTQAAGGTLQLASGPTLSQWDKLNITGTATLDGTLKWVPNAASGGLLIHDNETFTILTASGVTGIFATVTDGVGGTPLSILYNPASVVLEELATAPSFASLGLTANQRNIGTVLDVMATSDSSSSLITYLNSQPNAALPGTYDQLSPSTLTSLYQISFSRARAQAEMVSRRLSGMGMGEDSGGYSWNNQGVLFAGNLPASTEAAMDKDVQPSRWGVFVEGLGDFGTVASDGNGAGYQYSTGGTTAGLDYRFSKRFTAGLLLGYSQSGTSQSTGQVQVSGGQAGLYAGWKSNSFYAEALAEGGANNYTTQRAGLGGSAVGSTQGLEYSGQLGAGYHFKMDKLNISPFVSGQYNRVNINAFNETGSAGPLSYGAQGEDSITSQLGAKVSRSWYLEGTGLSPALGFYWEHVFQGNLDSLSASLGNGGNFTVFGPATGTDAAVINGSLDVQLDKGLAIYASYQGKLGLANYASQNLAGGVNIAF